jgi:hypothetical protein
MQAVRFTRMADGTREEYEFLQLKELDYISRLADRLLEELGQARSAATR